MRVSSRAARAAAAALIAAVWPAVAGAQTAGATTPPAPRAAAPQAPATQAPATQPGLVVPPSQPPQPTGPVRSLTVDEAVRLALEQNLDVQVQRISPTIQDQNVALAKSYWLPSLSGALNYNNSESPPSSFLTGTSGTLKTDQFQGNVGVGQYLPWGGGNYTFGWGGSRYTSNSSFNTFNPRLDSSMRATFVQPLLRNFGTDAQRTQLVLSKRNREISDVQFRATVVTTIRNVKSAYWDLKYAIANLAAQQQSLDLARQTLKDNRTRVEVGTMAPIDIVEAESEVARNEEAVIVAEAAIKSAEDRLRALIFDPGVPDFWRMTLDPVDQPQIQQQPIDIDGAIATALEKRTDLQEARKRVQNVDENLKYYRNQTLPQLNFEMDYGTTGLGGTEYIYEGTTFPPGPPIGTIQRSFWSAVGDVYSFTYPAWTTGVTVSYPLGTSAAKATLARTKLERNQAELQIRSIELSVGTQVRDVGRNVNTNSKRVEATRAARVLAERRLEAEQKKFGVGMSTSFLVFQAQRDLSSARVSELQAILDYNKSLADFEAVQEASLTGGGISIAGGGQVVSTAAGATAAAAATAANRQQ